MKISTLIFLGFLFILLLFSVTTYINSRQSVASQDNASYFARSTSLVRLTNRFQRNLFNSTSSMRGYLLTGDRSFLQAYDSAFLENEAIIAEQDTIGLDDQAQKKLLADIGALHKKWNLEMQPFRELGNTHDSSRRSLADLQNRYRNGFQIVENGKIYQDLQLLLRRFINREYDRREEKRLILNASLSKTKSISLYLTISSVIIGIVIAWVLANGISSRILKMVALSQAIAEGQYDVAVNDRRNDELGKLSRSLNHMSQVLDENFSLLKRKNLELDQFAHIVSHDLKAPLRGIGNVVSWIEEDHDAELPEKVREYLQLIKGRLLRAENLIGGILSYARVGKETGLEEWVPVGELVHEIVDNLALRNELRIRISGDLPTIRTERVPLLQVFSNLISNAVKYHDKPNGEISIYHQEYPDHYLFHVADDGPGIADHYHNRIFIIFQTLQERDRFESTGVGLAIVKKILDARKQTITLRSEPGKGAIFSFTWPRQS